MKKIRIDINDLIDVLEILRENGGTTHVLFFEHNNLPAMADADEPENIIMFQSVDEDGDGEGLH